MYPNNLEDVDVLQPIIEALMENNPDLSVHGWHDILKARPRGPIPRRDEHKYEPAQKDRRLNSSHVQTALFFLNVWTRPTECINANISSYGLSRAADLFGQQVGLTKHVTHGEFIAAALLTGLDHRRDTVGPGCTFNLRVLKS